MQTISILAVEDEPSICDNIIYAVEREGFQISCVSTGQEALEILKTQTISLVVLDVGLPDMNGFEICKEIRQKSNIPIIFLTARNDEIDKILGLEIGGDDYMTKPFSPRELVARIKVILRRSNPESTNEKPNEFTLDIHRYQISFQGVDLGLARYEYMILKMLLTKAGRVYTRSEIMDAIWAEPLASFDRTIDTHIKTIRSKIRDIAGDLEVIKTHRGIGYSILEKYSL
ncbi:MAG: two-component system response regulator CreB [Planctomycetota bacterium]|nr:MAG: two-component system response regulator CreB [Planctomycetota bacterium]